MRIAQIQAPSNAQRLTVKPSEIRPGDWMRDLGRFRRVESIEPVEGEVASTTLFVIQFEDEPKADFGTLGVWEAIPATIWREP
jgi:hypothetical protein